MTSRNRVPLTEQEKQMLPLPGEVTPQDALEKALMFAAVERLRANAVRPARAPGNLARPGKTG